MHNALLFAAHIKQRNAGIFAIFRQLQHLNPSLTFQFVNITLLSGDAVIHRTKGFVDLTHLALRYSQAVKGLRAGHFVNQMAVDI